MICHDLCITRMLQYNLTWPDMTIYLLSHPLSTHSPRLSDASEHWVPSLTLDGKIILGWITADLEPKNHSTRPRPTPPKVEHILEFWKGCLSKKKRNHLYNFTLLKGGKETKNQNLQGFFNQHFNFHVDFRKGKSPSSQEHQFSWRLQAAVTAPRSRTLVGQDSNSAVQKAEGSSPWKGFSFKDKPKHSMYDLYILYFILLLWVGTIQGL